MIMMMMRLNSMCTLSQILVVITGTGWKGEMHITLFNPTLMIACVLLTRAQLVE